MSVNPSASPHGSPVLAAASASPRSPEQELLQLRADVQFLHSQVQAQQGALQRHAAAASSASATGSAATGRPFLPKLRQPSQFKGDMGFAVDDWISEMEQQFAYYDIVDPAVRIKMAVAGLAGPALRWWDQEPSRDAVHTWALFVARLHARFRPVQAAMIARQRLDKLRQKTGQSVNAYANLFQTTLTPIGDMGDADQVHHFLNGLLPPIASKAWERHPVDLRSAIDVAVSVEAMGNFGRAAAPAGQRYSYGSSTHSSATVPMDLNFVEEDVVGHDHPSGMPIAAPQADSMATTILAKLEAMEMRINALAQGTAGSTSASSGKKSLGDRVPGLKSGDIDRLRAENRCFRCKKKGHFKRECGSDSSF